MNSGSQRAGSGPVLAMIRCSSSTELARPEITLSSASKPLRSSSQTTEWWPCLTRNCREPGSSCSLMSLNSRSESPKPSMYSAALASGIREQDLGRRLLDDRAADAAVEHVARALRRDRHHGIQLAPGLRTILRKALEGGIGEQPPELVHPAHEPPPVEQAADDMEEIERDRRARERVVEKVRDVDTEERRSGQLSRRASPPGCRTPRRSRRRVLSHQRESRAWIPSARVASVNSIRRDRRRADALERQRARSAWSRSASSRTESGAVPRTSARSQTFRNSTFCAVGAAAAD